MIEPGNHHSINYNLSKKEILRGHDSFTEIFKQPYSIKNKSLKAFIKFKSPSEFFGIKTGFAVSKKRLKKANKRNRVRRLLKESYRLNKHILSDCKPADIVIFPSEYAYESISKTDVNLKFFYQEMTELLQSIKAKLDK